MRIKLSPLVQVAGLNGSKYIVIQIDCCVVNMLCIMKNVPLNHSRNALPLCDFDDFRYVLLGLIVGYMLHSEVSIFLGHDQLVCHWKLGKFCWAIVMVISQPIIPLPKLKNC